MHIMEGFLPLSHALFWGAASAPVLGINLYRLKKLASLDQQKKLFLGACGGFTFILSALKLPSFTGSCSHPTGIGFGSMLFGPSIMTVIGSLVLLFQALLLAHGGVTTLGANIFSMAIVGSYSAFFCYTFLQNIRFPKKLSLFTAACISDLCTYTATSLQLAMAFPDKAGGVSGSFLKFAAIFSLTQIPLAISEGLLTVLLFNLLTKHSGETEDDSLPHGKESAV